MANEIGTNTAMRVFDKPISVRPSSSGNGEAMMSAPRSGDSHFRNPKWNECAICLMNEGLSERLRSSANRSRMKKNSMRSPQSAPSAPQMATV